MSSDLAKSYVDKGYCIAPASDAKAASDLRSEFVKALRKMVPGNANLGDEDYLNRFHEILDRSRLNEVRVAAHKEVGADEKFKKLVLNCFKGSLEQIVGNELAMQRQVNFVFQLPKDPAALIYLHTDSWSGCSPYEVVLWMPLVKVYGTKSMYLCERKESDETLRQMKSGLKLETAADLLKHVRPHLKTMEMDFGSGLLFAPTLLHGSEENKTDETRFILNVRFKGLYTPYGTKALGETFTPVNFMPATQIGLSYESEFGVVRG